MKQEQGVETMKRYEVIGRSFGDDWMQAYVYAYQYCIQNEKDFVEVIEYSTGQAPIRQKIYNTEDFSKLPIGKIFSK